MAKKSPLTDTSKGRPPEHGLIDVQRYARQGETARVPMPDHKKPTSYTKPSPPPLEVPVPPPFGTSR